MKRWLFVLGIGGLSGCAPAVLNPVGQNLTKGIVETSPTAPAVRVGSKANLMNQGKRFKFDVWIEADSTKGRLDALGPFGTPLASVIWEDSAWQAWLPGQATLLRGYGNSVNLPVLGIKDIRPSQLIAPFLGRIFPHSGPVKTTSLDPTATVVSPATKDPSWTLIIDPTTGLALRKQTMKNGREIEGLTFHHWRKQGDVLVPGTIDRTTPDGQMLQLELGEWSALPAVPPEHLQFHFPNPVDTITLARNDRGQTVYKIHPALGPDDSTSVCLGGGKPSLAQDSSYLSADSLDEEPEEDDSTSVQDSLDDLSLHGNPAHPVEDRGRAKNASSSSLPAIIPTDPDPKH